MSEPLHPQRDRRRPRILVVDDEPGPRASLKLILEPRCEVSTAASGAEALARIAGARFDLVTLDLNMPGMKGGELARELRRALPRVPLVIITGFGSIESAVEGIRAGVVDYLTKPVDARQVRAVVDRALFDSHGGLALPDPNDAIDQPPAPAGAAPAGGRA